jgi:Arc/MetJ family transcription regulator
MDRINILLICMLEMAMGKTTVQIDEALLQEAVRAIGAKTKKEAIEAGLKYLVRRQNREALRKELGSFDLELTLDEPERLRNAGRSFSDGHLRLAVCPQERSDSRDQGPGRRLAQG